MTTRAPIIFLIFNRPDVTARSFERIRAARPSSLFVVADGPRAGRPDDADLCAAARAVVDGVDWECEVVRDYSERNLGEVASIPAAIERVLAATGEAIVIEDDTVASPSFFRFCDELLEHYRHDERIMSITGFRPEGIPRGPYSYGFARQPIANGSWATWHRAWRHYDYELTRWTELRDTRWLDDTVPVAEAAALWRAILEGDVSPGDYGLRWVFNCWTQHGLGVVPTTNLVTNVGFGSDATRMRRVGADFFDVPVEEVTFPLSHPPVVIDDQHFNEHIWEFMCSIASPSRRRRRHFR